MFNWPELGHMVSLSLKQNQGFPACLALVGEEKTEIEGAGVQCSRSQRLLCPQHQLHSCASVTEESPHLHPVSARMSLLLAAWLSTVTFPASQHQCQQAGKVGQWDISPEEGMLPDH